MLQEQNETAGEKISFNPDFSHLELAQKLWNLQEPCVFIRHMANFVYQSKQFGQKVILRIARVQYRSRDEIQSELNWIDYLHTQNMSVSRPILSINGSFIEPLNTPSGTFLACLFSFAPGSEIDGAKNISPCLLNQWASTLAQFHNLNKTYGVSKSEHRAQWNTETVFADVHLAISQNKFAPENPFVIQFNLGSKWLKKYPQNDDNFGLIHADFHMGNFFVDEFGKMTLFDFDDCCYHWYLYDISVPIVSYVLAKATAGKTLNLCDHALEFYALYQKYTHAPRGDFNSLLKFIRFRITSVALWIQIKLECGAIPASNSQWLESYQKWILEQYLVLPEF